MHALIALLVATLRSLPALLRSQQDQAIVELALRQQLAIYGQKQPRPRVSPVDRAFWVALSRWWPRWKTVLVVVQPEAVVRWHRRRFRHYWRSISSPGPGRPTISREMQDLIVRMATENRWRARRIQGELEMLGLRVSLATISRYLPKARSDPGPQQSWRTFLQNHRDVIAAMDFFVVPTVRFQLLYAWFILDHGRRHVLHVNVTAHPSARWVVQQLREAFPDVPRHRYLVLDNDAIFSEEVAHSIAGFGIDPKRTALRSPWQNGTAKRFVGTVRRELLDHVVVLGEDHLRRLLQQYVKYYNRDRVHSSIGDAPEGRVSEARPNGPAIVSARKRVGGLHHRYAWREAV